MLPAGAAPTHPDPVPNPVLSWDLTHRSRLQSGGAERVHCSAGERPRGKAAGPGWPADRCRAAPPRLSPAGHHGPRRPTSPPEAGGETARTPIPGRDRH